jgi:hypothetical protein
MLGATFPFDGPNRVISLSRDGTDSCTSIRRDMPTGNETYDVFVSYSRGDSLHAKDIDSALCANGLKSFFDRRNLDPGLPWVRALEKAIGAAKEGLLEAKANEFPGRP